MEPWDKIYQKLKIPPHINIDEGENLVTFLEEHMSKFKDLPMYENMQKVVTFSEVDKISKSIATFLMEKFEKGSVIAVHMPNIIQLPITLIAILRAGMTVLPLNPLYTAVELEYTLRDANAQCVFTLENFAFNLAAIHKNVESLKAVVITSIGDIFSFTKRTFVNFVLRHVKRIVPSYHFELKKFGWRELVSLGQRKKYEAPEIKNEDIAFLQYTSGTTCKAKGVLLSHKNILANIKQVHSYCYPLKEGKETFFTPLPLYHSYALMLNFWIPIKLGAKSALITNPKKVSTMVDSFRFNNISLIIAISPLYKLLVNDKDFAKLDLSSLRVALSGGSALDPEISQRWFDLTKVNIVAGYGLTESSPCLSCNFVDNINFKNGTVGVPLPSTKFKFVDINTGKEVKLGEEGVMWVKGPQVAKKYHNNDVETEKNFVDGWLVTGDIGKMDEDGFVTIVGRVKEILNISGFNVSPYEIESVYNAHPQVEEAIAIQAVDDRGNDTVKLFVIKKDEALTDKELFLYGTKFLTNYKRPHIIEFVKEFPKSSIGKVLRYKLK